jgi:hypothetical protein
MHIPNDTAALLAELDGTPAPAPEAKPESAPAPKADEPEAKPTDAEDDGWSEEEKPEAKDEDETHEEQRFESLFQMSRGDQGFLHLP